MQIIYDVLNYVFKFPCFTSETTSTIHWDIDVLPSLTHHKVYMQNDRKWGLHSRVRALHRGNTRKTNSILRYYYDDWISQVDMKTTHLLQWRPGPRYSPAWRKTPEFDSFWWCSLSDTHARAHLNDISVILPGHSGEAYAILRSCCALLCIIEFCYLWKETDYFRGN
jgi:hypothetical protein